MNRILRIGSPCPKTAFTLLELMMVIAIITIVAALLLPALARTKAKAHRIQCLNNLKQVGVANLAFAHEHGERFPMRVSTNQGGSMEYARSAPNAAGLFVYSFRNFQVLSNDLVTPQMLVCRADKRVAASNFARLRDENVSYFAGLDADPARPGSVVAGDWNVTNSALMQRDFPVERTELKFGWTKEVHEQRGNVLFADGRVELLRNFTVGASTVPLPGAPSSSAASARQEPRGSAPTPGGIPPLESGSGWTDTTLAVGAKTEITRPPARSGAAPAKAPSASGPTSVIWKGETNSPATAEWDTENFRLFVTIAKGGYLVSLLWAVVLLLLYFLKKRRQAAQARRTD
jgi:prepilin-type N-terminal cleavage/methylation domain-containing protein/prepilin-type processing-associated H-X9-DG protein